MLFPRPIDNEEQSCPFKNRNGMKTRRTGNLESVGTSNTCDEKRNRESNTINRAIEEYLDTTASLFNAFRDKPMDLGEIFGMDKPESIVPGGSEKGNEKANEAIFE